MPNVRGDILIKALRLERGFTQEELCEGICSVESLSRIENGGRIPRRWTFEQLMERLGESPKKYPMNIVTVDDKRMIDAKDRLKDLLRKNNPEARKDAEELINKLENDKAFATTENKQFLLRTKASLALNTKNIPDAHHYALKALKVTRPSFDENKIQAYPFTLDEVWSVNQIAIAYLLEGDVERSTDVLLALKSSVEKGYIEDVELVNKYISILYNLSNNLGKLQRHEECLEICDIGVELARKYRNYLHYPLFLSNKAYNLLHLGRKDEAIIVLERVCALFWGLERYKELLEIRGYAEREFGIKVNNLPI